MHFTRLLLHPPICKVTSGVRFDLPNPPIQFFLALGRILAIPFGPKCQSILQFHTLFEGVCVNFRHPDPRRGEPRVGSAPDVAIPAIPAIPADPLQNSVRLENLEFYIGFGTFCRNWGPIFGPNP